MYIIVFLTFLKFRFFKTNCRPGPAVPNRRYASDFYCFSHGILHTEYSDQPSTFLRRFRQQNDTVIVHSRRTFCQSKNKEFKNNDMPILIST